MLRTAICLEIISLVNAKPTAQKTALQQLLGDASSLPKYCPNAFEDPDHNLFSNVKSHSNNGKCYYSLPTVLGDKQYTEKVNVRFASSKLKESVHDEGAVINENCMVSVNDVQKLIKENRIAARYSTDSLLYELYNYLETFRTHYVKGDKYYLYDNIPGKNSWDAQVSISENQAWREKQKFETHSHGSKVSVCEDEDDSESEQKCEHFNYIKLIRFSIPLKCQKVWYPEEDKIYYFWNFTYGFPYGKQPTRTIKEWSMEFEDDRETCYGTVADKTGNDQYRVAADFCRVYLSITSQGPVSISERLRFFYEEYPTVSVLIFLMFGLACLWTFYRLTKRVVPYKKGFDQAKQFYVETMTRKPRKNIQYKLAKEYRKSLNNQSFQPMQLIDEFNNYQQIVTECNIKKAVAPHRVQGGMNLPWKLEQYDVSISDPLDLIELTTQNDKKKVTDLNNKIKFQWNRLEQDLEKTKRHLSGLLKYTQHLDRYPDVFIGMQCKITLPKQMKRMNPNVDEEIVRNETIQDLFAKYIGISEQTAGNGTSAYINANRAPSFLRDNAYIATQGPKRETISHFWKMCYNEEPSVIVMLTKLKEEKVNKCDRYWPVQVGQQVRYDCMVVKLTEENVFQNYTRRAFEVIDLDKLRRDPSTKQFKSKKIVQYQYTEWRDRQGSASVVSLLDFRKKVRLEADLKPESPMVVHCSAGIGRTGCFIILDCCLQQIQVCWRINVMDMLTYLRVFRTQFIQTHQQYQFVYRSLAEAIVAYLNGCDLITTSVDFTSHLNKKYYANIETYFQQKNLDLTMLKNPPKLKLTERINELFFKQRKEARDNFEQSIFGSSLIQIYAAGDVKYTKFVKKVKKTSVKVEKSAIPESEQTVQYVPSRRFGDDREYEPVSPSDNGSNLALIEAKPLLKSQPISKPLSENKPPNTPLSEVLPGKSASGDDHETDDLYLVLYGLVNKTPIYSFKQNQRTVTSPSRNLDPEVWKNIYRYCWERSIKIIFRIRKEGDRDDVWPRDRDLIEEPHRIEDIDLGDKVLTIERFDDYISEQTEIDKNKAKYVHSSSPVNSNCSDDIRDNNHDVSQVFEMQKNADSSQVYSKPKGFLKKIEPFKLLLKDKDPMKTKRALMRRSPNRQSTTVKQEQKVAYWECSIHRLNNDYEYLMSVVRLIVDIYKLDRVKECLLNSPLVKKQSINLGSVPTTNAKGTSNRSSISSPANEQNSIPISMVSSCSSRFSNDVFQLQTYDTPLLIWDETETGVDIYLNMIVTILEHLETMLDTPEYLSQYKQYLSTLEKYPPDFLFQLHKKSNISKSFDNSVFHFGKDAKDTTKKSKKTSQEAGAEKNTTSAVGQAASSSPSECALNGNYGNKKFAVESSARSPTTEKSSTDSSLRTTPTNIESEFSSNAEDDTTKAQITPSLIDYSLYIVTRRFTEQYKPWFFKSENDYPKWISQIHQLLHDITSKKEDEKNAKRA